MIYSKQRMGRTLTFRKLSLLLSSLGPQGGTMEIAFSSLAGLACVFYLVVLGKFAHAHYKELVRRRVRPAVTHMG